MAGHSKFANIKHRKGAQDAKRSKMFTKIQREIFSAVKTGGDTNEEFNPRLRLAILKAKTLNMPKDKIEAAIKKATGSQENDDFQYIRYDCYASGGVGIIVEALTDNKNRTAGEVRAIITKHGGNMGETGSLDFVFKRIGIILYNKDGINFDKIFEDAASLGCENVEEFDDIYEVTTDFLSFHKVHDGLTKTFGEPLQAEIEYQPITKTETNKTEQIEKIIDALEDLDDVQNVWVTC